MKRRSFWVLAVLLSGSAALIIWLTLPDTHTRVEIFDVGQGDAIYIDGPNRVDVLIDGGPSAAILEKLSSRMPFFDRKIELVILTHPHADHLAGLLAVAERYQIMKVLELEIPYQSSLLDRWKAMKEQQGIETVTPLFGQQYALGDGVQLNILYPDVEDAQRQSDDANDFSVVAKLQVGNSNMLFTGDLTGKIEAELLQRQLDLRTHILKVAHHGSGASSREDFMQAVDPSVAIISLGKDNSYGHPAPRVLSLFEHMGIDVFRTDRDGDVLVDFSKKHALTVKAKNATLTTIITQNQQ